MNGLPSITSTDKSVCATPALPCISIHASKAGSMWHRHSCLCFGKVQRLMLLTQLGIAA
jgi:hypothetical protein